MTLIFSVKESKFPFSILYTAGTKPDSSSEKPRHRWNVAHHRDRGCRKEGLQLNRESEKVAKVAPNNNMSKLS